MEKTYDLPLIVKHLKSLNIPTGMSVLSTAIICAAISVGGSIE